MAMSGPNASWKKPVSGMKLWTMDSALAGMRPPCRRPASGSARQPCKAFSGSGGGVCRPRSLRPTCAPDTGIKWHSASLKSQTLASQYFKEGRALRTETVICNTGDFDIGRRVCAQNWNALRAVGEFANRSLCDAEAADAQPAPDVATFCQVTRRPLLRMVSMPQGFGSANSEGWRYWPPWLGSAI